MNAKNLVWVKASAADIFYKLNIAEMIARKLNTNNILFPIITLACAFPNLTAALQSSARVGIIRDEFELPAPHPFVGKFMTTVKSADLPKEELLARQQPCNDFREHSI